MLVSILVLWFCIREGIKRLRRLEMKNIEKDLK